MSFFLNRKERKKDAQPAKTGGVDAGRGQNRGPVDGRQVLLNLQSGKGIRPQTSGSAPVGSDVGGAGRQRRSPNTFRGFSSSRQSVDSKAQSGRNMRRRRVSRQEPESASKAPETPRRKRDFSGLRRFGRKISGVLIAALVTVCVLLLLLKGSVWIYDAVLTSDTFITRHIDVSGNVRLTRDMILRLGGLHEGENSFAVSISDVERRLRSTPWVEDVSVKRLLPDRFVIKIRERMPCFWVRHDDRLYYANDRGEIIAQVESDNFMSLPMLTIEPGGEDAIPYLSRLMKDMRSGALPIEVGAIATVDVSPSKGVEIYLEDREMRLSLAPDDWEGNLSRLGVAIGDLARRRELGMVQEARAADGSVWVSLRQQLR